MPIFETLEPVAVALDLGAADVRLAATDRSDTNVTVRPGRRADEAAVQAAEQVRVEYDGGLLRISSPKARAFGFQRKTRTVEIIVDLPTGSTLSGEVQTGDVHGSGRFGECRLKTSDGAIHLERTGPVHLVASDGDVTVGSVIGNAEISADDGDVRFGHVEGAVVIKNADGDTAIGTATGDVRVRADDGDINIAQAGGDVDAKTSDGNATIGTVTGGARVRSDDGDVQIGQAGGDVDARASDGNLRIDSISGDAVITADDGDVRIGHVGGAVVVKNSDGDTTIGTADGDVRVRADDGDIHIGRAGADLDAKTSDGDIRVGEVVQGSVVLESDDGDLEVGIASGTAAWLDVDTESGRVRSDLEATTPPGESERTVRVRGRTASGDITVRRAALSGAPR